MFHLYGIPNCDTVKKARDFLDKQGLAYTFINFKQQAPKGTDIERWKKAFGDFPVNKQGQTFKKLRETYETLTPAARIKFIQENPSMIKRPILEKDGEVLCFGFNPNDYLARTRK